MSYVDDVQLTQEEVSWIVIRSMPHSHASCCAERMGQTIKYAFYEDLRLSFEAF
jgi:hypothetical protein